MLDEKDFIKVEGRKFHLDLESKEMFLGRTLYRIVADADICDENGNILVYEGSQGGYVEFIENLSPADSCWIHNNAKVFDKARVSGCAQIYGNAKIYENSYVYDHAVVYNEAVVCGNAHIRQFSEVEGNATVDGSSSVYGHAKIYEDAYVRDSKIYDKVQIFGKAEVYHSRIFGNAMVFMESKVYGKSYITGSAMIYGNSIVSNSEICDYSRIYDNCFVVGIKVKCNGIVCQNQCAEFGIVDVPLKDNLIASIKAQTGLAVENNKVIAYKRVNPDLTSFYDENFKYILGEYAEVEDAEENEKCCASGLHFSYPTYWERQSEKKDCVLLKAEIDLDDIITVQQGKIRCKRAKILSIVEP